MNTAGREMAKGQAIWMTLEMLQLALRNTAALKLSGIPNLKTNLPPSGT